MIFLITETGNALDTVVFSQIYYFLDIKFNRYFFFNDGRVSSLMKTRETHFCYVPIAKLLYVPFYRWQNWNIVQNVF